MISRIKNVYLRRGLLIVSTPIFCAALLVLNLLLAIHTTIAESVAPIQRAWKGR